MAATGKPSWWVLGMAIVAIALTARLGIWQLDRAAQKTALVTQRQQGEQLPPITLRELPQAAEDGASVWDRRASIEGTWLPEHAVYIDNRPLDGRPGFLMLMPLHLGAGQGNILVQRGWVPRHQHDRLLLPKVHTPAGWVTINGRLTPPPSIRMSLGQESKGAIRQNIELGAFALERGLQLRPVLLVDMGPNDPGADQGQGLRRDLPLVGVDVSKHHGYATQWFALSALIAGLTLWFQFLRRRVKPS